MADRNRPHLFVDGRITTEEYSRRTGRNSGRAIPSPADRAAHARRLITALEGADEAARRRRRTASVPVPGAIPGVYVTFESFPGLELALTSLDPRRGRVHAELRSVHREERPAGPVQVATVFIPDGKVGTFVRIFEEYESTAGEVKPRHQNAVDRVADIAAASVRALWTDALADFPARGQTVWWEVWLRRRNGNEITRISAFAEAAGCPIGPTLLSFQDRTVLLVHATAEQLASALDVLDDLAELRKPHQPEAVLSLEDAAEQAEWVGELADRIRAADENAPAVCVLDTGIHQAHPLLSASLANKDQHTCNPSWGLGDHAGHGTEMAGLALFGDLGRALTSTGPVAPWHRLESVKLLPPVSGNPPHLWGALTATAASLVEIQAPTRQRTFSMAVTARDGSKPIDPDQSDIRAGRPTSWSAAVDALAAGRAIDASANGLVYLDEEPEGQPRLFVISAGNVQPLDDDHLSRSDLEPVEDPAQSWNALTVGAYTELVHLDSQPSFVGWTPLAPVGELSPFSRTSVSFARVWPPKPDVVLEGGNVARSPAGTEYDTPEVLQLLTTRRLALGESRLLTVTNATSAATAQAAHLIASVMSAYPSLWPETVRALVVHSARWTPAMHEHLDRASNRTARDAFRRRYGMGVPDLARATRSARDALTLISQGVIEPFDGQGRTRHLHLHDLPWPTDVLADLGEAIVNLRITLSYFIEPNPANRGWQGRYSYQSHGLRFDLRRASESTAEFRKRLNDKALDEDERRPPSTDSDRKQWTFGPRAHGSGSIHTDIWTGMAADLARRGMLAVYPVTGWWKDNKSRDRSHRGARYSLIVSIETPGQDVDVWTPVATQVGVPIEMLT
ncbi:S8 family peptidase [Frankia sp. Cr2]|uniref:S8 family peptidase n=1 Tax=Frankia sp. Cr2 TaxID=3073932 RepID=UPI002AD3C1F4|nr:S8 family peptidase [Frankia sp. Cr2]